MLGVYFCMISASPLAPDTGRIGPPVVQRRHRYMPPTLLRSQFETLEEPGKDEHPVTVAVHGVAQTVSQLLRRLADPKVRR